MKGVDKKKLTIKRTGRIKEDEIYKLAREGWSDLRGMGASDNWQRGKNRAREMLAVARQLENGRGPDALVFALINKPSPVIKNNYVSLGFIMELCRHAVKGCSEEAFGIKLFGQYGWDGLKKHVAKKQFAEPRSHEYKGNHT